MKISTIIRLIFCLLVAGIILMGCDKESHLSDSEISSHNRNVQDANSIDGHTYTNDYIGLSIELDDAYEIIPYEDLNLDDDREVNILLYAALNSSEMVFVTESIYKNEDYIEDLINTLESYDEKNGLKVEYTREDVLIDSEEAICIKVTEDSGDNQMAYYDYYFIKYDDSLITLMISIDSITDSILPKDVLDNFDFY